jgi:hypothetical protein
MLTVIINYRTYQNEYVSMEEQVKDPIRDRPQNGPENLQNHGDEEDLECKVELFAGLLEPSNGGLDPSYVGMRRLLLYKKAFSGCNQHRVLSNNLSFFKDYIPDKLMGFDPFSSGICVPIIRALSLHIYYVYAYVITITIPINTLAPSGIQALFIYPCAMKEPRIYKKLS